MSSVPDRAHSVLFERYSLVVPIKEALERTSEAGACLEKIKQISLLKFQRLRKEREKIFLPSKENPACCVEQTGLDFLALICYSILSSLSEDCCPEAPRKR